MAKKKNFDPNIGKDTQFKSGKEAAKHGQKGGVISGESRRKKRSREEILRQLLAMKVPDGPVKDRAKNFGLGDSDMSEHNYEEAMLMSGIQQAVKKGRTKDIIEIYKLLGEYTETMKVEGLPPSTPTDIGFVPAKKD